GVGEAGSGGGSAPDGGQQHLRDVHDLDALGCGAGGLLGRQGVGQHHRQNGQATAIWSAPVATASSVRLPLILVPSQRLLKFPLGVARLDAEKVEDVRVLRDLLRELGRPTLQNAIEVRRRAAESQVSGGLDVVLEHATRPSVCHGLPSAPIPQLRIRELVQEHGDVPPRQTFSAARVMNPLPAGRIRAVQRRGKFD
ncbi:MAG TPA: hypothetical protein VES60_10560, partial [Nakamurella sp.]|nr:hypothetical protein [Nakamurella sp.]